MPAFEQLVTVALEAEDLVVSEAVAFAAIERPVELVGARADKLVLAAVQSFSGSNGAVAGHVTAGAATAAQRTPYALLNDPIRRDTVVATAAARYGYPVDQVFVRLYVSRFAAANLGTHEAQIRAWCAGQHVGGGPIDVYGPDDLVAR